MIQPQRPTGTWRRSIGSGLGFSLGVAVFRLVMAGVFFLVVLGLLLALWPV